MGYYFKKARSCKDLDTEQVKRYEAFRSADSMLPIPQELRDRIEFIKEYVRPVTSGEVWAALEELVQDAFVTWILAGEDAEKVEWVDPKELETPPPTEEERKKSQEWWKNFQKEARERKRNEKKKHDEWERVNRPVLHFLRKAASFFRRES